MVRIIFVHPNGGQEEIEAEAGQSLMANAKAKGVHGIIAECGGSMVCGTCHVYLDQVNFERFGAPSEMEADMLEYVIEPRPTSRLACRLIVCTEMDGMEVGLPSSQH